MLQLALTCVVDGNRLYLDGCGLPKLKGITHTIYSSGLKQNVSEPFASLRTVQLCPLTLFPTADSLNECLRSLVPGSLTLVSASERHALNFSKASQTAAHFEKREEKVLVRLPALENVSEMILQLTCHAVNRTRLLLLERYQKIDESRMELVFGCKYFNAHAEDAVDEIAQSKREKIEDFQYKLAYQCTEASAELLYCDLLAKKRVGESAQHEFEVLAIVSEEFA